MFVGTHGDQTRSAPCTHSPPIRSWPPLVPWPPLRFDEVIANDYAYQYLETLGVNPTRENMTLLLKEMPIKKCHVSATWRSKGWLNDSLNITPGNRLGPGRRVEGKHGNAGKAGFAVAEELMPVQQEDNPKEVHLYKSAKSDNMSTDVHGAVDNIVNMMPLVDDKRGKGGKGSPGMAGGKNENGSVRSQSPSQSRQLGGRESSSQPHRDGPEGGQSPRSHVSQNDHSQSHLSRQSQMGPNSAMFNELLQPLEVTKTILIAFPFSCRLCNTTCAKLPGTV